MYSSSRFDSAYLSICRDYSFGRHLILAVAGDSHAKRLYPHIQDVINNYDTRFFLHSENLGIGGAQAFGYTARQQFINLQHSPAEVVILWIGSNDFDSIRPNDISEERYRFDLINRLIKIFKLLSEQGKIVYIVGIPVRFSTRNSTPQWLQRRVRAANQRLTSLLKNRFYQLSRDYWQIESFASERFRSQHRNEMVHFTSRLYQMLSNDVIRHIAEDLRSKKSAPCKFWHKLRNCHSSIRNVY